MATEQAPPMGLAPIGTSASIAAQAPALCRSYPASLVLRASPPSHTARPFSHELPVDPYRDHRWDFPCCVWSTLLACRRQYPGRSDGICSLVRFHHLRPSPKPGRVGSCISLFEACYFPGALSCALQPRCGPVWVSAKEFGNPELDWDRTAATRRCWARERCQRGDCKPARSHENRARVFQEVG